MCARNGFGVDGSKRILIGATNRPDKIAPAYLRHKRFSYLVHITPPDTATIEAIVSSKLKGVPQQERLVSEVLHMFTMNSLNGYYSAADICGIIEDACRMAIEKMVREKRGMEQLVLLDREMFERAFAHKPPSISTEALQSYDNFSAHVDEL
jgi:SpoVK/Ycf46/Vps4 family AAA+-type ATPase